MIRPHFQSLNMLGLGSSVGTGGHGISAEIVAVSSFEELEKIADQVSGS